MRRPSFVPGLVGVVGSSCALLFASGWWGGVEGATIVASLLTFGATTLFSARE